MEKSQFDAQRRERRTGQTGGGVACLAAADGTSLGLVDQLGQLVHQPLISDGALGAGGALVLAAGVSHRQYRNSEHYRRRRILTNADGWVTRSDLREASGLGMAKKSSKQTRPGLTTQQRRNRRNGHELAAKIGKVISGSRSVRGAFGRGAATLYSSFEDGLLVLGEPGNWKSAFLANQVLDHPGPMLVTSTKPEFWDTCAKWRRSTRGPVWIFHPSGEGYGHAEFRWNLVRGCRADADLAWARADALMDSASAGGLSNAEFWTARGRYLLAPLLVAADVQGGTLREVGRWVQGENYEEPRRLLDQAVKVGVIEPGMRDVLSQMTSSSAKSASGSAAQTASACLEFLLSGTLARSLCPDDDEETFDFEQLVKQNGTLMLATGDSRVLAPIISAIAAELRRTVIRMVEQRRQEPALLGDGRLDPPLGMVYDEASSTVPSVPVHEHAAQMRGFGVWHCVAVQNFAQVREKWGEEAATTLRSALQSHLVLALNDKQDREYYSEKIGPRFEEHIKSSSSTPDTLATRMFGNPTKRGRSASESPERVKVPIFPPEAFATVLRKGQGLFVPARGHAAVVQITHGMIRAERLTAKLATSKELELSSRSTPPWGAQPTGQPAEGQA